MRFDLSKLDEKKEVTLQRQFGIIKNINKTRNRIRNIHKAKTIILSTLLLSVLGVYLFGYLLPLQAATKTWDGGGVDNNWSTCANWNLDTCPATGDTVIFDSTSTKDVTIDSGAVASIAVMNINSGYSGTITLAKTFTITTFSQATGSFTGAAQTLSIGSFTLSGGTFTASSGTMNVSGNFTVSGSPTFNANGGTVTLNGTGGTTQTLSCNNITFNLVVFARLLNNATTVVNSNCSLPLGNNPTLGLAGAGGNGGILTLNGTLSGTGTMTVVSNTSIGLITLNTGSSISGFSGLSTGTNGVNLTVAGATMDFSSYTTFAFIGAVNVSSGSLSFPSPTGTGISLSTFTLSGGSFTASPGLMSINSNFTITSGTFSANGGTITFNGAGGTTQTLSCNNATFNLVNISRLGNNATTTVNSNCSLPLGNNPTLGLAALGSYGLLNLNGSISGTGTVTVISSTTGGGISFNSGSTFSGFSGFVGTSSGVHLTVAGPTLDWSAFTTFSLNGNIALSSGSLILPTATGALTVPSFSQTGGTFTASPSTMTVAAFSITGTTTFNANSGTIAVNTSNSSFTMACNNSTFNKVTLTFTGNGGGTIPSGCNLPLGANPNITFDSFPSTGLTLGGSLSGTGTLTMVGSKPLTLSAGSTMTGFSGLNTFGLTINASYDFSSYSTFLVNSGGTTSNTQAVFTVNSGTVSLPSTYTINAYTFSVASTSVLNAGGGTISNYNTFSIANTATFNKQTSSIVFATTGSTATVACGNASMSNSTISMSGNGGLTVASDCNIPLGNNPTIALSNLGSTGLTLNGTISGTGTATFTSARNITLNLSTSLSGFSGITSNAATLVVAATADFSSYTTFNMTAVTMSSASGNLTLPNSATIGALTVSAGILNAPSGDLNVTGNLSFSGTPTLNMNSGRFVFSGSTATLSCNNATFNLVSFTGQSATKTINSNCNLPLGNNPTIPTTISLSGTLSGTGTLTHTTNTMTMNTGASLSGFTGFTGTFNSLTIIGPTVDFSAYTTFNVPNGITISGGSATLPNNATVNSLTVNGGTLNATTGNINVTTLVSLTAGTLNAPSGDLNVGTSLTLGSGGTFNHNNGAINFTGSGNSMVCNNKTLNLVKLNSITGSFQMNAGCTAPLGNNPTIANSVQFLGGTFSGTGTLSFSTGTVTTSSGAAFSGFSDIAFSSLSLTGSMNFSSYNSFTASGSVTVNASTTLTLPSGANISGGLTVSGSSAILAATTGNISVGGTVTLVTGTITAPTGNFNIGGNFVHTSGTFTHNSGTVVFNGTNQTISGIATTFNNFTKVVPSASAQTLTFPSNITTTFLGSVVFNGFDTTARLLIRATTNNTRASIDPQGARNLLYLDVKDSNNINVSPMQVGGTGSIDSANNISWNFGSLTPNDPSNLGPSNVISAIIVPTLQPSFTFTLSDPNVLDTVKYQIQISTVSNYATTVVDYTSALAAQSSKTFTVGQLPGSGTYTTGSSGQSLTTGSYYWRVIATDNNGLVSNYSLGNSGSVAFLIDSDPPDAFTPTLNVTSPTTNATPQVTFSTTDNVAVDHYQVKVDSGSFSTRTSPYTLPTLGNGVHTITVRSYDTTGNTRDGSVNVTVDTSLPNVFTPTLNVTSPTTNQTPQVSFSTTDNDGIDHYEVKIDSGSFTTQTSPYTLPTLAGGAHTITVRAFDIAGNTRDGSVNVTVDLTAPNAFTPTFNVSSPTANVTPQVIFSTSDNVAIGHYEVDIDGGGFSTHTSPYTSPTLSNGGHTFTVRAFDTAGNFTDGSNTITIDTSGPVAFTPTLNVSSPTNNQTPQVSFSTTSTYGIDHYEVKIDGGLFTTQTSPYTVPSLSSGGHTITVRAFDTNSNTIDGSVNVTIDITGPNAFNAGFTAGAITNDTTPSLAFTTSDFSGINHYEVSIDGGSYTTQTSTYVLPVQTQGSHTADVRAYDNAGNYTDSPTATIYIDTTAPDAFTPTLNVTSPTTDAAPIVSFSTTDDIAINNYQVRIDSGSFVTRTSPYQLPTLSNGAHAITVRAFDTAGNFTDGSVNVIVDVSYPDAFTPTLNVTSPTNNQTPQLSFNTTDDVGIDHYEVKIDAGSFSTQTSPYTLPTLASGSHTITVRAFNVSGNTTDGTVNITVDITAPSINANVPRTVYNSDIINTTFSVTDVVGVSSASVNATGGVINCNQFSSTVVNCNVTISSSGTLHVNATDNAGNVNSQDVATYVIETVAPVITITAPTKSSSSTITDTTVNVTDDYGIDVSDVVAISGGTISCSQTNFTTVDCTSTISVSGDLVINANDLATNAASQTETGYVVSSAAPLAFTPTLNVSSPTSNNAPILFFSTTDSDGIDRYEVKIDSGSYTIQVSPYQLPTLSDGFHTFTVRAFDTIGNFTDGVKTLTVDTTGPAAFTPTLNVTSPTNNTTPILSFITTDGGGINHYEVKIDSGSFVTRISPYQLPAQSAGNHTYTVRAFDNTGNFTDGSVNLTVNTQAPASFTPTLNVSSPTNNTSPTLSFSTTDDIGINHYEVKIDSGSFVTQTSPYSLPTQSEGNHTYTVRAFDDANNSTDGSVNLTIDTIHPADFTPTLNVTSPTNNQTPQVSFSTTDNLEISYYQVQVDGGSFTTQISPYTLPALAAGDHTIVVRAFDTAGNSTDGSVDITIELSGPAIFTPVLSETSPTNNTTPSVSFVTTSNVAMDHYEVALDGGGFVTQTSPYQLPVLSDGNHTVIVRAIDVATNYTDGSVTFTIDTIAPNAFTPTITSPTNDVTPDVSFSTTDNIAIDHYEVQIDSGSFSAQTSPYTIPTLSSGNHSITVVAFDTAGNNTNGVANVFIDTTLPVININAPTLVSNSAITNTTIQITDNHGVNVSDINASGGTINCTQTNATTVDCTSNISTSGSLAIDATDTAGNLASNTQNGYIVDAVPPVITITAPTKTSTSTITDTTIQITDNYQINAVAINATGGIINCNQTNSITIDCNVSISTSGDLVVNATDVVGNTSTQTESNYVISNSLSIPAPFTPTLNTPSYTTIKNPIVSFVTTDDDGIDRYEVKIDNGPFIVQTSPYQLPELVEGFHTIVVRAYSNNGNFRDGSVSVTIDTISPSNITISLNVDSPTNNTRPIVYFAASDENGIDHYEVKVASEGGVFRTQTSPYQVDYDLDEEEHTITLRAYDKAGNVTEVAANLLVDTTAPTGVIIINNDISDTEFKEVNLSMEAKDNLSGVTKMIISENSDFNGAGYEPYSTNKNWILSNDAGKKTIYIKFKDAAGNVSETYSDSINYIPNPLSYNQEIPVKDSNNTPAFINIELIAKTITENLPSGLAVIAIVGIAANLTVYPKLITYGLFLIRFRKKKKTWGIVYDKETREPIAFATVRLYSSTTKQFVTQQITDVEGKYGFVINKGEYILEVKQTDYVPYKQVIEYRTEEGLIAKDIGLLNINNKKSIFKFNLKAQLYLLNTILVYIGFTLSVIAIITQQTLLNIVVIILYVIQFTIFRLINKKRRREWGYVYNSKTNQRIKGAFVRVYDVDLGRQIEVIITDEQGRYTFSKLKDGEYLVTVYAEGYIFPSIVKPIPNQLKSPTGIVFVKVKVEKGIQINLVLPLDPA